jgi:hypothetical protein
MFGSTRRLVVLCFQFEEHFGILVAVVGVAFSLALPGIVVSEVLAS